MLEATQKQVCHSSPCRDIYTGRHLQKKDSSSSLRAQTRFKQTVWDRVAAEVTETAYDESEKLHPLQRDGSDETIARQVAQFNNQDYTRTDGVYVLECCRERVQAGQIVKNGVSHASIKQYSELGNPRRVLYVGVSENIPRRIDQHLNKPGKKGAYFTAMYRPVRILQIGWFMNYRTAAHAERLAAKLLRERFPNDFVAQPG